MIFGISAPKFVYDPTGTPATVELDYVVVLNDKPEIDLVQHKSIIDGHREFTHRGKHWFYQIRVHLFKYVDPRSKYEEILQYQGSDVILYRHRDGDAIKDGAGNDVVFVITGVEEAYLNTPDYKDVLIVRFESKDYVDLSDGSAVVTPIEEILMSNDY